MAHASKAADSVAHAEPEAAMCADALVPQARDITELLLARGPGRAHRNCAIAACLLPLEGFFGSCAICSRTAAPRQPRSPKPTARSTRRSGSIVKTARAVVPPNQANFLIPSGTRL